MKSPESLVWNLALVFFLLNAETKAVGEEDSMQVTGILDGSVTFQLRTRVFTKIFWFKIATNKNPFIVTILNPTEQCKAETLIPAFKGRLNFSKDCQRLELRNLTREDSGTYTAQIELQPDKGGPLTEIFHLQVYKRLSGADLTIQCDKTGNETRRLTCSVGAQEDDVRMSWTNATKGEILGNSVALELSGNYPEQNLTCTARNPVSNASRTVSLKEACEAEHPGTRASTESTPTHANKGGLGSSVGIAAGVIVVLALVAFIAWFCWKKRKAGHWKHPDSTETEEQSKTIYAEVEGVPMVVGIQEPRRGGKAVKPEKEKIQTIYTTVDHFKPSPLQTDDEKMGKGRRPPPEQRAKTTYAEISAPQESEDRAIKSIYDTVKNPQLPRGTEYDVSM